MAAPNPDEFRMSLGDHLEELRYRLLMGLIGPVVFMLLLIIVADPLIAFLVRPMLVAQKAAGVPQGFINTTAAGPFNLYFFLCMIGGLVLGIPWLFWQLWKFIEPGLHQHERRVVRRLLPSSALLAFLGVTFMYYILLPVTLLFLIQFAASFPLPNNATSNPLWDAFFDLIRDKPAQIESAPGGAGDPTRTLQTPAKLPVFTKDPEKSVEGDAWIKLPEHQIKIKLGEQIWHADLNTPRLLQQMFTLDDYISMVMWLALAFSVAFQLPLVMFVLAFLGATSYAMLKGIRKYAFLTCVVVAAILTPGSDPFSLAALTLPLYLLYEMGLLLTVMVDKKRARKEKEEAEAEKSA